VRSRCCITWLGGLTIAAHGFSCGGNVSGGGSSVIGTIGGASVQTADVVALVQSSGGGFVTAGVAYTNVSDTCGVLQRVASGGPEPASTVVLSLSVNMAGTTVPAGTYAIGAQSAIQVAAQFITTDSTCMTVAQAQATSGTIVYATVSATTIQGTFDVTFGTDRVTGRFTAPLCNAHTSNTRGTPACGH
jgi:hypothetical protein